MLMRNSLSRLSRISRLSLFLLPFTFGLANAAPAYPEYRVTIVGPPDSTPADINQAGVVVGSYPAGAGNTRAFVSRGTGYVDIGTLGGTSSRAVAINDRGVVLGNWTTASGQQRGFTYYRGWRRDLGTIPGRATTFIDINNAGYILALGGPPPSDPFGRSPFGFLRAPNGSYRNIGTLAYPNAVTQAEALNNRNQVTGESGTLLLPEPPFYGFLWTNGVMRKLDDLGPTPNYGLAINDRGQVAGYAAVPGFRNQVATIWSKGRLIDIDGRPPSANPFSTGDGINNHGHVVGSSDHLGAYIYRGKRMQSLNALVDPKLGWDISFPRAINDAGQVAATGMRAGVAYAVRLDLIRPHALGAPQLDADDEAGPLLQATPPAQAASDARADAAAQASETVGPVTQ